MTSVRVHTTEFHVQGGRRLQDPGTNPRRRHDLTFRLAVLGIALAAFAPSPRALAQSPRVAPEQIRGADLSTLYRLDAAGAVFTEGRVPGDALQILASKGMNLVRLRLWHTPEGGHNGLAETLQMAQRIKDAGLALLLDFHYSDTWADPGRQTKPAAWQNLSFDTLLDSVRVYTREVVGALEAQGTLPEMVQLGNEIIGGMLWPEGRLNGDDTVQWDRLANLLKTARAGLDEALDEGEEVEVMIHIDRGGNLSHSRWFFDHLVARDVPFDVIGQSFYPWWHGTLTQLQNNLNALATRYAKDLVVVELAYPFTLQWKDDETNIVGLPEHVLSGYPATGAGQSAYLRDVTDIVYGVNDGRGRGFVYWEAAWIAWPGVPSPWENVTLFNFGGEVLPVVSQLFRSTLTGTDPPAELPAVFGDLSIYPQPAGPAAHVAYHLSIPSTVTATLLDVVGRIVATPLPPTHQQPGRHEFRIQTDHLPSGAYLIRLSSGSETSNTALLIIQH